MTRVVVTGAAGFLGGSVLAALAAADEEVSVRAVDIALPEVPDTQFSAEKLDLTAVGVAEDLAADADIIIHLAALPGGAAESDPDASRRINLDASLRLIDACAKRQSSSRFVYASSIAVFGTPLPERIDDTTLPLPSMTYGTHKLMVETALADVCRRGLLTGVALRLPGLVARPGAGNGLRSAFLTNLFHAAAAGRKTTLPVSAAATLWLMSVRQAATNIVHAAFADRPAGERTALTLPAIHTPMAALVAALSAQTGGRLVVDYDPDAALEAQFGALPPLCAALAEASGYRSDGNLERLITTVLEDLGAVEGESA